MGTNFAHASVAKCTNGFRGSDEITRLNMFGLYEVGRGRIELPGEASGSPAQMVTSMAHLLEPTTIV
jgi:hypothetical protein